MNKLLVGLSLAGLFTLPGLSQAYVLQNNTAYKYVSTTSPLNITVQAKSTGSVSALPKANGYYGALQPATSSGCVYDNAGKTSIATNTTIPIVITSNNSGNKCNVTAPTICCTYYLSSSGGF